MALYLYFHTPTPIFKARVNIPSPSYPIEYLQFDGVTLGAYGDVEPGMFFAVGSTEGGDDRGRGRVQNPLTSTAIPIGRTSQGTLDGELDVVDNDYITIYADFRIHAKIPFIEADGTMYKDSSTAIGDNTTDTPPVANLGPGFAATIDSVTDVITVSFDGGISFATADGATITDFLWDVKDGTITVGSSTDAQITATFPAGFRWVALLVTDSNGKVHTARAPILGRDPANDATFQHWIGTQTIRASGQRLDIRILEDAPRSTYPDGCLVMFWEDEPLSPSDRNHVLFIGWHQSDQATVRATRTGNLRDTVLQCVDVAGRLDTLPGFPQVINRADTPDKWTDMLSPTMDRFIHYILHWHSTALELADYFPSDTGDEYPFVIFTSQGESLYSQVNNEANALVPDHEFTCNRRGQLAIVADPMLQDMADRTLTVQGTFTEEYTQDIRFTHNRPPRVHWMRGNALRTAVDYTDVDGVDTLFTAHCIAPGTAPGQGVSAVETNEQLARSQDDLNAVTGHRYARANAPYGPLTITPPDGANYTHIDPATKDWVNVIVSANTAAQRGLTFSNTRTQCKEIEIRYSDPGTGLLRTPTFQLEIETVGLPAETVIPAGAPVDTDPAITLVGANPLLLDYGDTYTDPGATADDYEDGDITANIIVGGDVVDTGSTGDYVVTYDVTDAAGNEATQVTRTVTVAEAIVSTIQVLQEWTYTGTEVGNIVLTLDNPSERYDVIAYCWAGNPASVDAETTGNPTFVNRGETSISYGGHTSVGVGSAQLSSLGGVGSTAFTLTVEGSGAIRGLYVAHLRGVEVDFAQGDSGAHGQGWDHTIGAGSDPCAIVAEQVRVASVTMNTTGAGWFTIWAVQSGSDGSCSTPNATGCGTPGGTVTLEDTEYQTWSLGKWGTNGFNTADENPDIELTVVPFPKLNNVGAVIAAISFKPEVAV